jgi:hypothetical protein
MGRDLVVILRWAEPPAARPFLEYSVNVARKAVAMRLPAAERVPGRQGPSLSSLESILFLANMLMHL